MMKRVRTIAIAAAFALSAVGLSDLTSGVARADERPSMVFAVDNLWPTMDPVIGLSTTGGRVHWNLFDTLLRRNLHEDENGNTLIPWLATKWERTSPTVWTITLRDDVKFHDGHPMDAEDVAFSISEKRLWGPEPEAPRGTRYARGIVRVEATGPLTVEIETAKPDPAFPNRLVTNLGFVLPKHYYEEVGVDAFGQAPIGTGPYKLDSFDPSDKLVAKANDDWWAGNPPMKEITWKVVPEYSTRFAGLAAGEFDMIVGVPTDQIPVVEKTDGVKVFSQPIENYPMLAFNMLATEQLPDNPLQDENLRKAMVSAIDRDAITEALWAGATFTPAPFNFPEYGDYYDPDRKARYSFNPEQAKELLAKSNYDGRELVWHITRGFYPNYETAAEIMIEQWRDVGINVRMKVVDNFSLAYERPFHLLNMSMSSEFSGDPYRPLWLDWGPNSSRVKAKHKTWAATPEFYTAGEAFESAEDFDARKAAYLTLVDEWENVTPGMYLWRNVITYAHKDDLDFKTGSVARTLFDHLHLKVADK
ncbi:MAG: ABC transporter substrate-binding protein [Stappiaceae bacterium]